MRIVGIGPNQKKIEGNARFDMQSDQKKKTPSRNTPRISMDECLHAKKNDSNETQECGGEIRKKRRVI
jgi:hypothetical protein